MGKRILVIGNGGREHAIVWKLTRDGHTAEMRVGSIEELVVFARGFDVTIVGPDQYLADGVVDKFEAQGLRVFGPTQKMAQIEASKAFAKELMSELGIPTATRYDHIPHVPIVIKKIII